MNMDVKVCGDCNLEKSLENFTYRKDTERYESRCCDCIKEYHRKYYLKNKEKLKNVSNLHYRENVEKVLIRGKKYRENNIEIIKKRKSDYHIKNVEKIREKTKNWRKEFLRNFEAHIIIIKRMLDDARVTHCHRLFKSMNDKIPL